MPAAKTNFIAIYKGVSQVYSSANKDIVLGTPLPKGATIEDKRVFFISFAPDDESLVIYKVPQEEVIAAHEAYEVAQATKKSKEKANEEES